MVDQVNSLEELGQVAEGIETVDAQVLVKSQSTAKK